MVQSLLLQQEKTPQIVIVPGGTGQIGSKVVEMFLGQGADVVVPSLSGNFSRLCGLLERYTADLHLQKCDYKQDSETDTLIKSINDKIGSIDALIYCAGVWSGHQLLHEVTYATVRDSLICEVESFLNFVRAVLPGMAEKEYGRIIAMGTYSLSTPGKPYLGIHRLSKSCLEEAIKTIDNEQGYNGVSANMIAPSIVCTDTEKKLYPGIDEKNLVPISAITECMKMLCYSHVGQYLHGQTIGLCSPWGRYLMQQELDLKQRGCAEFNL